MMLSLLLAPEDRDRNGARAVRIRGEISYGMEIRISNETEIFLF